MIPVSFLFFFNDTATTEIYTLSLHDALPIFHRQDVHRSGRRVVHVQRLRRVRAERAVDGGDADVAGGRQDRKSTRLNSSHANISYAVFCLKKKKKNYNHT